MLPLRTTADLGAMTLKGYSTFSKAPRLEPHHQMVLCHKQDTRWRKLFTESLLRAPWLTEKQPITGRYQHICHTTTRAHVLQTIITFFFLLHQRYNTESWLLTKQATASSEVHTLRTWKAKILLLHAFKSIRTSHQNYMELKELLPKQML